MPAPPDLRALLAVFFAPAPAASPLELLRAAAELRARSSGAVTDAPMLDLHRALQDGAWSERLFGPLHPLRCRCNRLRGPECRGETCDACGVVCTDEPLRERRLAHVDTPFGVVHPALAPRLAAVLDLPLAHLLALARAELVLTDDGRLLPEDHPDLLEGDMSFETGVQVLRRRLAGRDDPELRAAGFAPEALLLTSVPVPPPGERPLYSDPCAGEDRWFRRLWSQRRGRDNLAVDAFVAAARHASRMHELPAPAILLGRYTGGAQREFDAALDLLGRPPGDPARASGPLQGWSPSAQRSDDAPPVPEDRRPFVLAGATGVSEFEYRELHLRAPHDPAIPRACAFVDRDRAVIALSYALVLVDCSKGHVLSVMPAGEARLLGVAGRWAVFGAKYGRQFDLDDGSVLRGLHALDLSAGTWLEGPCPAELPAIFVEKDQPEDAWLTDWRHERVAAGAEDGSGDRADEWARSPDHRYIWISSAPDDGAIVDTERGLPVLMLSHMRECADSGAVPTVALAGPEPEHYDELDGQLGPGIALARVGGEWRVLLPSRELRRDGPVALTFSGGAIECAAFDVTGERLLLVNRDALHVVDVARAAVLAQLDLRPLAPALALPDALPPELADLVLAHHGTLAAALAQPDERLLEIPGLGPEHLAALRGAAVAAVPDLLPGTWPNEPAP